MDQHRRYTRNGWMDIGDGYAGFALVALPLLLSIF